MSGSKMNGSVELLAKAMRRVFSEAVEGAVEPLRGDHEGHGETPEHAGRWREGRRQGEALGSDIRKN